MAEYRDPYRAYNFKLEVEGVTEGHFTECEGLGIRVEAIKYREAGNNQVVHAVPGRVEYGDVTLRYGLTNSRELFDWMTAVARGETQRRSVSIVILDNEGSQEMMRWNLDKAWPIEWRAARLDALTHQVAIEHLTLVCDEISRD